MVGNRIGDMKRVHLFLFLFLIVFPVSADWITYSSEKGRFTVDAPSLPVETNKGMSDAGVWEFQLEDDGRLLITFGVLTSSESIEPGNCNPLLPLDSIEGERIVVSGVKGVQQNFENEDGTMWGGGGWTFCFGNRYYQVDIFGTSPDMTSVIRRIRESFRFNREN